MSDASEALIVGPSPASRRWWQFSLREIGLLMLAASAILALIVQQRPFRCTTFFDKFAERQLITNVCGELGIPVSIPSSGGGQMQGPRKGSRDLEIVVEVPATVSRGTFITSFRKHVLELLNQEGCVQVGEGWVGDPAKQLTTDFSFDYEQGPAAGEIHVESSESGEEALRLRIWMIEFPR